MHPNSCIFTFSSNVFTLNSHFSSHSPLSSSEACCCIFPHPSPAPIYMGPSLFWGLRGCSLFEWSSDGTFTLALCGWTAVVHMDREDFFLDCGRVTVPSVAPEGALKWTSVMFQYAPPCYAQGFPHHLWGAVATDSWLPCLRAPPAAFHLHCTSYFA